MGKRVDPRLMFPLNATAAGGEPPITETTHSMTTGNLTAPSVVGGGFQWENWTNGLRGAFSPREVGRNDVMGKFTSRQPTTNILEIYLPVTVPLKTADYFQRVKYVNNNFPGLNYDIEQEATSFQPNVVVNSRGYSVWTWTGVANISHGLNGNTGTFTFWTKG